MSLKSAQASPNTLACCVLIPPAPFVYSDPRPAASRATRGAPCSIISWLTTDKRRFNFSIFNPPFYASAEEVERSAAANRDTPRTPFVLCAPITPRKVVCTSAEVDMITAGGEEGYSSSRVTHARSLSSHLALHRQPTPGQQVLGALTTESESSSGVAVEVPVSEDGSGDRCGTYVVAVRDTWSRVARRKKAQKLSAPDPGIETGAGEEGAAIYAFCLTNEDRKRAE
ncbi:hypothetical protein EI94DRAFT_1787163 [Lactarius quietus]|nr:hypothetical protein EI94DRAFT_1787163 [Lactarius quietus]